MGSTGAIIGGGLIAAAILFTNHWQIATEGGGNGVLRLNRWTGATEVCIPTKTTNPASMIGVEIACNK